MFRTLLFLLTLAACAQPAARSLKSEPFINQKGQIQVIVCGRGCAQYLLQTGGTLYSPQGLPADYHTDQTSVVFSGELLADSTVINKFGPADELIPYLKVRNLRITHIVKQ